MTYLDPTFREQTGPDADTGRRQSQLLESYLNNAWISWTPTIGASSGSPTLGNGTFPAVYKRLGSACFGYGKLTLGTTTSFGVGPLTITLPFASTKAEYRLIGTWHAFHLGGTVMAIGTLRTQNSTTLCDFVYPVTAPSGAATQVSGGSATPWGWAATDFIDIQFCYEVGK